MYTKCSNEARQRSATVSYISEYTMSKAKRNVVVTKSSRKTTAIAAGKPVAVAPKPVAATADNKRAIAADSAANAERTAQPGIIATIMSLLCDARDNKKPTTTAEMLAALTAKFARPTAGLQTTLRAQLSRLPNERKFGIDKKRDTGVVVYYAAATGAKRDAKKLAA